MKNPDDIKLAPLGKLSNMQIRAAITEISFLGHNSIITGSAVAQNCVKAHMQSQWRKPKFEPP